MVKGGLEIKFKTKLELLGQVYLMKENNSGTLTDGTLLAIGGRYDYLLHQMWGQEHVSCGFIFYCIDTYSDSVCLISNFHRGVCCASGTKNVFIICSCLVCWYCVSSLWFYMLKALGSGELICQIIPWNCNVFFSYVDFIWFTN